MSREISWHVELAIKPGSLEEFRMLTDEMIKSTRNEVGALIFERFISDNGKVAHVLERYSDSDSAQAHLEDFKDQFAQRFSGLVERRRFTVLGSPSDELRTLLDQFGATEYLEYLDGFSR